METEKVKEAVTRFRDAEKIAVKARVEKVKAIRDMILVGMSYTEMADALGKNTRQSIHNYYMEHKHLLV